MKVVAMDLDPPRELAEGPERQLGAQWVLRLILAAYNQVTYHELCNSIDPVNFVVRSGGLDWPRRAKERAGSHRLPRQRGLHQRSGRLRLYGCPRCHEGNRGNRKYRKHRQYGSQGQYRQHGEQRSRWWQRGHCCTACKVDIDQLQTAVAWWASILAFKGLAGLKPAQKIRVSASWY